MDLDDLIVEVYWLPDDNLMAWLRASRLRKCGPESVLCECEVRTIAVVGEYLGLAKEKGLFEYFRRHYSHFFPCLARVHRTTFVPQAANLWTAEEYL